MNNNAIIIIFKAVFTSNEIHSSIGKTFDIVVCFHMNHMKLSLESQHRFN